MDGTNRIKLFVFCDCSVYFPLISHGCMNNPIRLSISGGGITGKVYISFAKKYVKPRGIDRRPHMSLGEIYIRAF